MSSKGAQANGNGNGSGTGSGAAAAAAAGAGAGRSAGSNASAAAAGGGAIGRVLNALTTLGWAAATGAGVLMFGYGAVKMEPVRERALALACALM